MQRVLLPHTVDLDISNAMFTLSWCLVQRLDVVEKDLFREELETLERLCRNRADVIRTELRLEPSAGKDLLLKVVNGKLLPADLCKNSFLLRVRRLGFFLRWLACSTLPDLHDRPGH